jgi:hypothetical protein
VPVNTRAQYFSLLHELILAAVAAAPEAVSDALLREAVEFSKRELDSLEAFEIFIGEVYSARRGGKPYDAHDVKHLLHEVGVPEADVREIPKRDLPGA